MKIVATTSLPAVDRSNADHWNAARSRQLFEFLSQSPNQETHFVLYISYSRCLHGSQFSGEKNDLKIQYLVTDILSKNPV